MGLFASAQFSETGASIFVLLEDAGVLPTFIMSEWALFGMQRLWKLELLES